jgi:ATP-dependent DNA helicase
MALRRTCCHPYLFHWPTDETGEPVTGKELVAASGKMMMLERLLGALLPRGHKVLIFSQVSTASRLRSSRPPADLSSAVHHGP